MKKILLITLILTFNFGFSQNYKFGKVSKEELLEKENKNDLEANATVLYRSLKIKYDYRKDDGFVQVLQVFERIKIYNQEGSDYANQSVRLYDKSASNREKIRGLKGVTYNLVNGKVQKTKLKKEGIFDEKNNKFWATTKFTMPNIKNGTVIEFEYQVDSPYMAIDNIDLQYNIPIKKSEIIIQIPEYFKFNKTINPKASYTPKIVESSVNRREVLTSVKRVSNWQRGDVRSTEQSEWDFVENKIVIIDSDIPALKKEIMVDNLNNYKSKLIMEYAAYKDLNDHIKYYSHSWKDVVKTISKSSNFGGELNKTNYYKDDIDAIIKPTDEPLVKAAKIYDFIKSKMKWNGFVGYRSSVGVKKAYKEGTGSTGDINLMLTSMLRYAGLNASPVLLSTRDNGIPIRPTTEGFNYVIAAVELPQKIIYLDGTSKYSTANILPKHVLNWQGRIIRESGSSTWVDLTPKSKSKEIVLMNIEINSDLSISGKIRKQLTDYLALKYREKYYTKTDEVTIRGFENNKGDIEISNLTVNNKKTLNKAINYSYDFKMSNEVEEIGDKIYISPLLFLASKENPFKQDSRTYPIDFIYPTYTKYSVNLKIPEGYVVESLPENIRIQLNETEGEFSFIIRELANGLQIVVVSKLNKTFIMPTEYNLFKQFFQKGFEKQIEKIVLKKH